MGKLVQYIQNLNPKVKDRIFIGSIAICVCIYYALYIDHIYKGFNYWNGDFLVYPTFGRDIFAGNVLLKGWYGSTNAYYLLSVLYGFFGLIFGYRVELLAIVSAFLFALMTALTCKIVLELNGNSGHEKYVKVFFVICLLFNSCYAKMGDGPGIWAGSHFDSALVVMLFYYFIGKKASGEPVKKAFILVAYLFLFLAFFSDGLTMMFLFAPLLMTVIWNGLAAEKRAIAKSIVKNLIPCVVLFLLSKAFAILVSLAGGITVPFSVEAIRTFPSERLFERVGFTIEEIFYLFSADFFDIGLSLSNWRNIAMAIVLFVCFFALALQLRSILQNVICQIFFSAALFSALFQIFVFEGYNDEHDAATRTLYIFFFSLLLLFSSIDLKEISIRQKVSAKKMGISMLCLSAILIGGSIFSVMQSTIDTYVVISGVVDILNRENRTKGLGAFWCTNPVMAESEYAIQMISIDGLPPKVFEWLNKMPGEDAYADFVVIDESGWGGLTEETLTQYIGKPEKTFHVNEGVVMLWNENIMPRIRNVNLPTQEYVATALQYAGAVDFLETGEALVPSGTVQFGPYVSMEPGNYLATFEGENLENVYCDVISCKLAEAGGEIDFQIMEQNEGKVEIYFTIENPLTDVEYRTTNTTGELIRLSGITVNRVYESTPLAIGD